MWLFFIRTTCSTIKQLTYCNLGNMTIPSANLFQMPGYIIQSAKEENADIRVK